MKKFNELKKVMLGDLAYAIAGLDTNLLQQLSTDKLKFADVLNLAELYSLSGRDIAVLRQVIDLNKRYIPSDSTTDESISRVDEVCTANFVAANKRCLYQNSAFHLLDKDIMTTLDMAHNYVSNSFWRHMELGTEDGGAKVPYFIWMSDKLIPFSGFNTGSGSCCGSTGISPLEKYRGDWSFSTDRGIALAQTLRAMSSLLTTLPNFAAVRVTSVEACFVPKNSTTSRLIAPQYNGDLYLQYPAEQLIKSMLLDFNINMTEQQDISREFARKGSLHDNMDIFEHSVKRRAIRYCTIDLSSASDIIGTRLVKHLFPHPLFEYMDACRSSSMLIGDVQHNLNMMATMGSAYCSAMQTIVFASIIKAVYYRLGIPFVKDGVPTYSVYGDDIIVDITAYKHVIKVLECLNMVPNQAKSFAYGFFRESCGADYYRGYDVRPIMIESLDGDPAIYSAINRYLEWSAKHSVDISNTIRFLMDQVGYKCVVPYDYGDTQGFRVPAEALKFLPQEWKTNIKCSSNTNCFSDLFLLAEDYYIRYGYNEHRLDHHVTTNISVSHLLLEGAETSVRLSKTESSLFPFLRGGVKQLSKVVDADKPQSIVHTVPCRGESARHVVSHIPYWNAVDTECHPRYYGLYWQYFSFFIERMGLRDHAKHPCQYPVKRLSRLVGVLTNLSA